MCRPRHSVVVAPLDGHILFLLTHRLEYNKSRRRNLAYNLKAHSFSYTFPPHSGQSIPLIVKQPAATALTNRPTPPPTKTGWSSPPGMYNALATPTVIPFNWQFILPRVVGGRRRQFSADHEDVLISYGFPVTHVGPLEIVAAAGRP